MGDLYNAFEPKLKFLGTMNGASENHTNAFFFPNDDTLVFLDLSLLNAYRAEKLLKSRPGIKNFYVCLTHNHFDHASGLEKLAYDVKVNFYGSLMTILTDDSVADETIEHLDNVGLRPLQLIGGNDKAYDLFSFEQYGGAWTFRDWNGAVVKNMSKPDWFIKTMPTSHSPRLHSCGFALMAQGTIVVYSGDTSTLAPFKTFFEDTLLGASVDLPVEFYLDVATRDSDRHVSFQEGIFGMVELLNKYPTMKIILMHYDDQKKLEDMLGTMLPERFIGRIIIASRS